MLIRADLSNAGVIDPLQLCEDSHALVIGVDRYNAGWPVLRNAVKDAKLVAESLEKRGFKVTLKLNTDSATLEKTLKEFFVLKGQKPETRLFVWFAGHGHTENGEGYLGPSMRRRRGNPSRFADLATSCAWRNRSTGLLCLLLALPEPIAAGGITRATTLPVRQFPDRVSDGSGNYARI